MKIPSRDEIQKVWPPDVPVCEKTIALIISEWIERKMSWHNLSTFVRNRVITWHKGQYAIPGEFGASSGAANDGSRNNASVGPFCKGTGGGRRNIRKGHEMS